MKIETITFEYEHCGECGHCEGIFKKGKCLRTGRVIPDIWGKIPDWCPLPDKEATKPSEGLLLSEVSNILHRHYYPTMHEQIADSTLEKCAQEVINLIKVKCEAECQERVESVYQKIIERLRQLMSATYGNKMFGVKDSVKVILGLKKQEGIQ